MTKENNLPLTSVKHIYEFYWYLSNKDKKAISDIIIKTLQEAGHKPTSLSWGIDVCVYEREETNHEIQTDS